MCVVRRVAFYSLFKMKFEHFFFGSETNDTQWSDRAINKISTQLILIEEQS